MSTELTLVLTGIGLTTGLVMFFLNKWISQVNTSVNGVRDAVNYKIDFVVSSVEKMEKTVEKVEQTFEKRIDELKEDTKEDIKILRENDREIFAKIDNIKSSNHIKKNCIIGKKCLIVDDEKYKGELVKEYLEKIGVKSKICISIDKALHLIKNGYDFLVLDWFLNSEKNRTAKEIIQKCIDGSLYINGQGKVPPYYKILIYSGQNYEINHQKGCEFIDFPFGETDKEIKQNLKNKIEGFFRYDNTN